MSEKHPSRMAVVYKTFDFFDLCVDAFAKTSARSPYSRACGLTILKARNLGQGAFGMILDGLGQEAGALIRPMIECAEILTYLRLKPDAAEGALQDELPKAGERAKFIGSIYQNFRQHLNQHASHTSFGSPAITHLINSETLTFKRIRNIEPVSLERNIRDLVVQLHLLLHEAALATEPLGEVDFLLVVTQWQRLKNRMFDVYGLNIAD